MTLTQRPLPESAATNDNILPRETTDELFNDFADAKMNLCDGKSAEEILQSLIE
jgi:hypothetical protein